MYFMSPSFQKVAADFNVENLKQRLKQTRLRVAGEVNRVPPLAPATSGQ